MQTITGITETNVCDKEETTMKTMDRLKKEGLMYMGFVRVTNHYDLGLKKYVDLILTYWFCKKEAKSYCIPIRFEDNGETLGISIRDAFETDRVPDYDDLERAYNMQGGKMKLDTTAQKLIDFALACYRCKYCYIEDEIEEIIVEDRVKAPDDAFEPEEDEYTNYIKERGGEMLFSGRRSMAMLEY